MTPEQFRTEMRRKISEPTIELLAEADRNPEATKQHRLLILKLLIDAHQFTVLQLNLKLIEAQQ